MERRALANIGNATELDGAMAKLSGGSKAMAFLQGRIANRGEGETDLRPAHREVHRIAGIEFCARHTDEDRALLSEALIKPHAAAAGFEFTDEQIEGLLTYDRLEGLFGPVAVGAGKTFISLLCAALAFERGCYRSMLLVPSQVYEQLVMHDIPQARRDLVLFGMPFHYLGGETRKVRRAVATSGRRGCYVMPYSLLSTKDTSFLLDNIAPDLIIADEAHRLKNLRGSARTQRIKTYCEERDPKCVALSGTMTQKSVMDYWHLLIWCLGPGAVLPLTHNLANEWAQVLDSETLGRDDSETSSTGALMPLVQWARKHDPHSGIYDASKKGFRAAYRLRLASAPGVVMSTESSVGTSLYIENDPARAPSQALTDLMTQVVDEWETPQGEPIEYGLHKFKWLNELTAGFWHRLEWPHPDRLAKARKIPATDAAALIERAKVHHEAQKMYHGELRKWLQDEHIKSLDTPFLVAGHITRYFGTKNLMVSPLIAGLYMEMKSLDFDGRPERIHDPILVDDYKLEHAVAWAKTAEHGILWYHHQCIGRWLDARLDAANVPHAYCPAGKLGNRLILNSKDRIAVASIQAHNTGKNLQFHEHQHVVQWPRSAKDIEQMLGRVHRQGQMADELTVQTNLTTDFDRMLLATSLVDALYIHQTGGGQQKAIVAGWNPLPELFPASILEERGLDPAGGAAMAAAMRQHFGKDLTPARCRVQS